MKLDVKDVMAYGRKILIFLIRGTYRSACEHPFVLAMLFLLLLLHIFLPYVFGLLVSSSPVIICTVLLLGTLLSFGRPNIPETETEEKTTDELLQVYSASNDLVVKKDDRFSMASHIGSRENFGGTPINQANFTVQGDHVCKVERAMPFSASTEEEDRKVEAVGTCSSLEWSKKQINIKKNATDKKEINGWAHFEKAESLAEYLVQDGVQVAHPVSGGKKEAKGYKMDIYEAKMDTGFDSSPDSSQKLSYSHDGPDSSSEHTETRSPDASLTGIIPMLDELHPLIDSGAPQPVNNSHSMSGRCVQGCKSDDDVDDKAEHRKDGAQEEKYDESAIPATCAADDEKNHMDLSSSILERTRRLKSLILKRRARKKLKAEAEKSLRGLDVNKPVPIMGDLAYIQLRIPPVSSVRQDPFDLSFNSEESTNVLQIPGSAPSALLPRGDLFDEFDILYDQEYENGNFTGLSPGHQGSLSLPQKDMLFRRYESFSLGASFTGEVKEEMHYMKLRPDFGTGRRNLEDDSCADFHRQLNDKSLSKIPSVPGSEPNCSVVGMEDNELVEQELHQCSHAELIFPCDVKHVRKESSSSSEVDFSESPSKERGINIYGTPRVGALEAFDEETHETFDDFVEYEKKIKYEMDLYSSISDAANSDLTEPKGMESSSTCPLKVDEKNFSTRTEERSTDLQQSAEDYLTGSNYSAHSFN